MRFIPRKYFRFGLSTLMLLITVFCVWMGVQVNRARDTRLAIDAIEELGGEVYYVHERTKSGIYVRKAELPGPAWLREFIGDEYFVDVANIAFSSSRITDDDLEQLCTHLTKIRELRWLYFDDCHNLSDISVLQRLSNLQRLVLCECDNLSDISALQDHICPPNSSIASIASLVF